MAEKLGKQTRYQQKMRKKKKCPTCGAKTNGHYYCAYHRKLDRERKKKAEIAKAA
jgi:hypothetical protein